MKLIEEIEKMKIRYSLTSSEVLSLHLLAVKKFSKFLTYDDFKREILEKNKDKDKNYEDLF